MTTPFYEPINRHLVVLLDPRSLDGETGLHHANSLASEQDIVTLAVWLHGPGKLELQAFADEAQISLEDAVWLYMNQAASRLHFTPMETLHLQIADIDLGLGLARWLANSDVTDVVLPASLANDLDTIDNRITLISGLPVAIAQGQQRASA